MRKRRDGSGVGREPLGGPQYRRALARDRAVLGGVQASLWLLTGSVYVWARPEVVAGWARGFLGYYLAGLAACSVLASLVLVARCGEVRSRRWSALRMGTAGTLLVATLPVVVVATVGR